MNEETFDSPQLTQSYQERSNAYCMQLATIHSTWTAFIHFLSLLSFIGGSTFPITFWTYAAVVGSAIGATFIYRFSNTARRHIVPLLSFYCIAVTAWLGWLLEKQVHIWTKITFDDLSPSLSGAPGTLTQEQLEQYIGSLMLRLSCSIHLILHTVQLLCLCIATTNWYTMLAMWTMLPAFLIGTIVCPYSTTIVTLAYVGRLSGVMIISTVLKLYLGSCRLTSFMNEVHLMQELQAAHMSDSVLSHSLKNTMSDVASTIDLFLNGEVDRPALQTCSTSLCREIRGCCDRSVFVNLVSGAYSPKLSAVSLRDFGSQLIAGRRVLGDFLDLTVYLDELLLHIIMERILSSAFRNSNPDNPRVQFQIEKVDPTPFVAAKPGSVRIRFAVSHWRNEVAQQPGGSLDPSLPPLAESYMPSAEDDMSLKHCLAVAQQYGVVANVTEEEEGLATFVMELDALVASHNLVNLSDPVTQELLKKFPPGLNFFAIDDSAAARQLLSFHIRRWMAPGQVQVLGATEAEVLGFVNAVLERGDVVICDQHLNFSQSYLGTDLIRELRRRDFCGFVCIRSANNNPKDVALYMESGADCIVGKDVLCSVMMDQIKAAYVRRHGGSPPARSSASSTISIGYQPLLVEG
eukprot:GGOE01023882.1.p1 GENE.GGOE01023882.1~~GGOE01023882.1.p1  ORF type:complete len:660 (-),score=180.45 GGOE01023882.1:1045-2940(-)